MSVTLGSILRHHRILITSGDIIFMTATLHNLARRTNFCLRNLDEISEDPVTVSDDPEVLKAWADSVAKDTFDVLTIDPAEDITDPAKSVAPSAIAHEDETQEVDEAQ
jgi:hypothetical protein